MIGRQPGRRRFTVSLRFLIILVLGVGLWMGWQVNKAREQREAVEAIKKYGGWVHYDYEFKNGKPARGAQPPAPVWLRRFLGDEFFRQVHSVNLVYDTSKPPYEDNENLGAADDVLARLGCLSGIRSLYLHKTQATDLGLKQIRGLSTLEELVIVDAENVTDAGLVHIGNLRQLKRLSILESKITDPGLRHLRGLKQLEFLGLGAGDKDPVSAQSTFDVKAITDAGMAHLEGLSNLKGLSIMLTQVTDAGLEHLRGLKNLRPLGVRGSWVTDAGVQNLRRALPNVGKIPWAIEYDPEWTVTIEARDGMVLGTPATIRDKISAQLPNIDWTRKGFKGSRYIGECYSLGFQVSGIWVPPGGDDQPVDSFTVEIKGGRGAISELLRFTRPNGWIIRTEMIVE